MTDDPAIEAVARAIDEELGRDFQVWLERYVTPAGSMLDAPEPPLKKYDTSPEKLARAAIAAYRAHLEKQGLVVMPREPTDEKLKGSIAGGSGLPGMIATWEKPHD